MHGRWPPVSSKSYRSILIGKVGDAPFRDHDLYNIVLEQSAWTAGDEDRAIAESSASARTEAVER